MTGDFNKIADIVGYTGCPTYSSEDDNDQEDDDEDEIKGQQHSSEDLEESYSSDNEGSNVAKQAKKAEEMQLATATLMTMIKTTP